MKNRRTSLRTRARYLIVAALAAGAAPVDMSAGAAPRDWARVYIADSFTREAVAWSLEMADSMLAHPRCDALFAEFHDPQGRPLTEALAALGMNGRTYLRQVVFLDGTGHATCAYSQASAFTQPGSRVVFVCGRGFEHEWRVDARASAATLVHEMLHSLGLAENPPSSRFITGRVHARCGA